MTAGLLPVPLQYTEARIIPDLTDLLLAHRDGSSEALQSLVSVVYEDLRRIARQQLARLRSGNTLDTTALVNEAYLKIVNQAGVSAKDANHFFAIAATAMRQILVDHVRRQSSQKRGGAAQPITLDRVEVGFEQQADLVIAIDAALDKLSTMNARLARVFECRFFAGLGERETADALDLSVLPLHPRRQSALLRAFADGGRRRMHHRGKPSSSLSTPFCLYLR